jgi:hypothetical protein
MTLTPQADVSGVKVLLRGDADGSPRIRIKHENTGT